MTTKVQRQQAIGRIISRSEVGNQPQLVDLLADEGITATQATVSRDLDDLGAIKVRVPGGSTVYAVPEFAPDRLAPLDQLRRVMGEWVADVAVSANLVVAAHPARLRPRRRLGARPQRARRSARHRRRRRHTAVCRGRDDHGRRHSPARLSALADRGLADA